MYEVGISYEEFLKKEQEKYPELNLNDIESLKERVKANSDLPYIRGTNVYSCSLSINICFKRDLIILFF